ncbi:adaptor protein MecA [Oenococcus oeni]|uniref:adaptor protein MecA n=3 Tax=Oenococcus oeni TaxID=1247 RepID=UPI0008F971F2|nr:adaptor protein MecA [Oenococcus oeni]OIK68010.1 competence protein [Oenococcus oeni]OIL14573.1 competence protein [Oenococcus oeni]
MKLEKIDANTLHIMLTKADLDDRHVSMMDLMSDRSEVESFFYSILDEADADHSFSNDDQVTFQILPTGQHGVQLFISKIVDDPNVSVDESGKAVFSLKNEQVDPTIVKLLRGYDDPAHSKKTTVLSRGKQILQAKRKHPHGVLNNWYLFTDFDEFLTVVNQIDSRQLVSDLYEIQTADKNSSVHRSFLLHLLSRTKKAEAIQLLMSDFGLRVDGSQIEASDLKKPIFLNSALELSKKFFKN